GGRQVQLSKVDANERFEVRSDDQVVAKPGVFVTEVRVGASQDEPVRLSFVGELETNHLTARGHGVVRKVQKDPPHEEVGVHVLAAQLQPSLAPGTKRLHNLGELQAAGGQVVGRSAA